MGKWSKYPKSFQRKWLADPLFSNCIMEVKANPNKAFCKVCNQELRAHKADLKKHCESSKHKENSQTISTNHDIKKALMTKGCAVSKLELKLAVFVACHASINSINHLSELVKQEMPRVAHSSLLKDAETLRLHRTKCTALLCNVISPSLLKDQVHELKNTKFSLIIDESTDIACVKHLCVCCRYFSTSQGKIVSEFLGLIPVTKTDADTLYKNIKDFFAELCVDLKNCFAIATDGASNLCGRNHSVFTLMKKDNPHLILVKCVCHSLHLVCLHAFEELPSNIDYMLRETYNWFSRSALRRDAYMTLYKLINDGKPPLQMIPLSSTRWLARSNSVKRILEQYDTLKMHFQSASQTCDKYVARELYAMYSDSVNHLYLTFLKPLLEDFENINLLFQKDDADHSMLLNELESFTHSMIKRIVHPTKASLNVNFNFNSVFLPLKDTDFGYEFSHLMSMKCQRNEVTEDAAQQIYQRCQSFLKRACEELLIRLPRNAEVLKKVHNLSPNVCLSHIRPPFLELPLDLANQALINDIESQWRRILSVDWATIFSGEIPHNGSAFWSKVLTIKNAGGKNMFKEIASFALTVYSLPISNATVERVFSRVSSTKTKLRNRMGLNLLSAILRVKMSLEGKEKCCVEFEPSPEMLKYDSSIYKMGEEANLREDEDDDILSSFQF